MDVPRIATQDKTLFSLSESTHNFKKKCGVLLNLYRLQDTCEDGQKNQGYGTMNVGRHLRSISATGVRKKNAERSVVRGLSTLKIRNEERRHQTCSRLWMNEDVPLRRDPEPIVPVWGKGKNKQMVFNTNGGREGGTKTKDEVVFGVEIC